MTDLLDAYEFADVGQNQEFGAFVCLRTGTFYFQTDPDISGIENELLNVIDNIDLYLSMLDRRELDLGRSLVLDFVHEARPQDNELMRSHFHKRGAHRQFRSWSDRVGLTQVWCKFRQDRTLAALRVWAVENGLQVLD